MRLAPILTWIAAGLMSLGGLQAAQVDGGDRSGEARGRVTRVTLYRGQALVTRRIELGGESGGREVVVTDLPQAILEGSLYAESGEGVEIRAVRFRQRAVGEEPREEVRKMDDELTRLRSEVALTAKRQELAERKFAYLDQLESFVAPTAQAELSHGVLNAETLEKLTEFAFAQRQAAAEQEVTLAEQQQKLAESIGLLERKRNELTAGSLKTVNEAVIFLEKRAAGAETFELNYLVQNCGWNPNYTIRAGAAESVDMEYNGLIQQMTGEDWSDVQLTLSTASPALSASGPSLAPFYVSLAPRVEAQQAAGPEAGAALQLSEQYRQNRMAQSLVSDQFRNVTGFQEKTQLNWSMNVFAGNVQQLELDNSREAIATLTDESLTGEGPSLSYLLPEPVSLASRNDQQMVRIFKQDLPSAVYQVATPLLSSYVYREAEVRNASTCDLLGGQVTVYRDGRFVGRAEIPTVAQGEAFVLGLGAEAQLRARRELVSKQDSVQGGNLELRFAYRVSVENYKSEPVSVRIFERLPYSQRASDVRVSLGDLSQPLSADSLYVRTEKPKGILRWDVEVPAVATGEKAFEIAYDFTLDHDRNLALRGAAGEPDQLQEFQELERVRMKR